MKIQELDVNFIGGGEPLSNEEKKALSEFIKQNQLRLEKEGLITDEIREQTARICREYPLR